MVKRLITKKVLSAYGGDELGPIGFIILFGFLLLLYPFTIAPMMTLAGENAVAGGATGLEAFAWMNLNLWIILTLVLVVCVYFYLGGER